MKITLSTTNNIYMLGWYGSSNETEPFDLEQISQYLHSVHKIADDNYTWQVYKPTNEENDFTQLEVGNIYYLNFYASPTSLTFEIPNLFSSSSEIEDFDRGVLEGIDDLATSNVSNYLTTNQPEEEEEMIELYNQDDDNGENADLSASPDDNNNLADGDTVPEFSSDPFGDPPVLETPTSDVIDFADDESTPTPFPGFLEEVLPEDDVVGVDDTFGVIASDIISRGIDTNNDGEIDQLPTDGELFPTPSSTLFSTDDDFLGGIDDGTDAIDDDFDFMGGIDDSMNNNFTPTSMVSGPDMNYQAPGTSVNPTPTSDFMGGIDDSADDGIDMGIDDSSDTVDDSYVPGDDLDDDSMDMVGDGVDMDVDPSDYTDSNDIDLNVNEDIVFPANADDLDDISYTSDDSVDEPLGIYDNESEVGIDIPEYSDEIVDGTIDDGVDIIDNAVDFIDNIDDTIDMVDDTMDMVDDTMDMVDDTVEMIGNFDLVDDTMDMVDDTIDMVDDTIDMVDDTMDMVDDTIDMVDDTMDMVDDSYEYTPVDGSPMDMVDDPIDMVDDSMDMVDDSYVPGDGLDDDSMDMVDDSVDMVDDHHCEDTTTDDSMDMVDDSIDMVDDSYVDNGFDDTTDTIDDSIDDNTIGSGMEFEATPSGLPFSMEYGDSDSMDDGGSQMEFEATPSGVPFSMEYGDQGPDFVVEITPTSESILSEGAEIDEYNPPLMPNAPDEDVDFVGDDGTQMEFEATPSGIPFSMEYGEDDTYNSDIDEAPSDNESETASYDDAYSDIDSYEPPVMVGADYTNTSDNGEAPSYSEDETASYDDAYSDIDSYEPPVMAGDGVENLDESTDQALFDYTPESEVEDVGYLDAPVYDEVDNLDDSDLGMVGETEEVTEEGDHDHDDADHVHDDTDHDSENSAVDEAPSNDEDGMTSEDDIEIDPYDPPIMPGNEAENSEDDTTLESEVEVEDAHDHDDTDHDHDHDS